MSGSVRTRGSLVYRDASMHIDTTSAANAWLSHWYRSSKNEGMCRIGQTGWIVVKNIRNRSLMRSGGTERVSFWPVYSNVLVSGILEIRESPACDGATSRLVSRPGKYSPDPTPSLLLLPRAVPSCSRSCNHCQSGSTPFSVPPAAVLDRSVASFRVVSLKCQLAFCGHTHSNGRPLVEPAWCDRPWYET